MSTKPDQVQDSDPRTCKHLFELARLPESAASTQPCVATLLREQRLIAEPSVLATLRSALRAPAVFCISLCACCCMRNLI